MLIPVIDRSLDSRRNRKSRSDGSFTKEKRRRVRFFDNTHCVLARAGYSLRDRCDIGKDGADGEHELTLKLRLPDIFAAGASKRPKEAETKFEEDIAPLEVLTDGGKVLRSTPRSMRSRFSLSVRQPAASGKLSTTADILSRFEMLEANLKGARVPAGALRGKMIAGPAITEVSYDGAGVKLGNAVDGEFTLTLWYFGEQPVMPEIAEISFRCDLSDGTMPEGAARRAYDLFVGMQNDLGDWLDLNHVSKTAMALPDVCTADRGSMA